MGLRRLLKEDGSFWACGKDLGNQTGKLEEYYEAGDYETTYMVEFVPMELVAGRHQKTGLTEKY